MPYITPSRRKELSYPDPDHPKTPGELNYMLTRLCLEYQLLESDSYTKFNDILGALEGCKQEFYRRKVAPYENQKIKENGDVY